MPVFLHHPEGNGDGGGGSRQSLRAQPANLKNPKTNIFLAFSANENDGREVVDAIGHLSRGLEHEVAKGVIGQNYS